MYKMNNIDRTDRLKSMNITNIIGSMSSIDSNNYILYCQ